LDYITQPEGCGYQLFSDCGAVFFEGGNVGIRSHTKVHSKVDRGGVEEYDEEPTKIYK
jgi:hypothetical protein